MTTHILELDPPAADERLAYGSHPLQFGDLRLPAGGGPHPIVVYVHGGFWRARYDLGHAGHVCAALTAAGIATWNIEYRRLGNGGGWPATFADVAAAADHVRQLAARFSLDLNRLVAAGHSAGGQLALWLAARGRIPQGSALHTTDPIPIHAAVSIAGVCDLRLGWEMRLGSGVVRDLLDGTPDDVPDRYAAADPAERLPLGIPQILIHGTADESVPYEVSVEYHRKAIGLGDVVELRALNGIDHFAPIDPRSEAWRETQKAIEEAVWFPSPPAPLP
ncbi:MAG TPA: alpha/beta hydrolase, partial [Dongiaceae bacterium]